MISDVIYKKYKKTRKDEGSLILRGTLKDFERILNHHSYSEESKKKRQLQNRLLNFLLMIFMKLSTSDTQQWKHN